MRNLLDDWEGSGYKVCWEGLEAECFQAPCTDAQDVDCCRTCPHLTACIGSNTCCMWFRRADNVRTMDYAKKGSDED